MASRSEWLDAFLAYDFDESYFDSVDANDDGDDTKDDDWWGLECDSEDEAEFDFVNPLVVVELIGLGYLKEGQGDVDATQVVAMSLYILGHNTRMRCVVDRFQHSTKMVSRHFHRVLQAFHSYARHLIKPDPDVVCLPEHLQVHTSLSTYVMCKTVLGQWMAPMLECSANDLRVLEEVIDDPKHGFPWPSISLPISTSFLPPHKSTRYHAQEFHSSNRNPTTKKVLFNYRHSSLRMVIERSFGVLKARFPIFNLMPNFKRSKQCYVITACCCLHNFMRINNRCDKLFITWDNVECKGNPVVPPSSSNNGGSTSTTN
nr:hypothetical protein CFP56_50210 [Quercus suber]POE58623.1 hypothetical protein CFP56_50212 [Quercus suber]